MLTVRRSCAIGFTWSLLGLALALAWLATGTPSLAQPAEEPIAGLTASNDSPTLETQPTMLTAIITAGTNVSYTWAFGDDSPPLTTSGTFSNGVTITHTYPADGVFTAIVTARNSISEMTATTEVTIKPRTCYARLNDGPVDYLNVQAAVDASTDPADVVRVAGYCAGTTSRGGYRQTVYVSKTLTIRGGYTTTNWLVPDSEANPTTLDAQRQGRVFYITGNISATVEGLNITGGKGSGLYVMYATISLRNNKVYGNISGWIGGGGLYIQHGAAILLDNSFTLNTSYSYGGGMRLHLSDATLIGNNVSSNIAHALGGGLMQDNGESLLMDNIIANNATESSGGGVWIRADATLINNTITGNSAQGGGGGLAAEDLHGYVVGNTVSDNFAGSFGGGISSFYGTGVLTGNTIIGNATVRTSPSSGDGGGLRLQNSNYTLVNNLIANNQAGGRGSGLYTWNTAFRLFHNTIVGNGEGEGSGLHAVWWELSRPEICYNGRDDDSDGFWDCEDPDCCGDPACVGEPCLSITMTLSNTILVSHTVGLYAAEGTTVTLEATLWGTATWANGDDWAGAGTIVTGTINQWGDPVFVAPDDGDYHLGPGSGAIDAGVDAGVAVDLDGEPRPAGLGFDIGADEFHYPSLRVAKDASTDVVASGQRLTYTLHLTNDGTISLTAAITDVLPEQVTPSGALTWLPPPLPPGGVWTETIAVTANPDYAGPLTNVVRAGSLEGASGAYTHTVLAEQAIAGLETTNDSPTELGSATTLMATVAAGSPVSFTWSLGDGGTGSGATLSHTYPAVGIYTAAVTASNHVSQLTATTSVHIVDETITGLAATNDSPTALGNPTTLTATVASGSNVTYTWALGDGATASGATIAYAYPAPGTYSAVVSASNSVSEMTATTTVTVEEALAGLVAANDSPTELGSATTLIATISAGSNVSYTWDLGDGSRGTGAVLEHVYPGAEAYTAVVTAGNRVSLLTGTTVVNVMRAYTYVYLPLVLKGD